MELHMEINSITLNGLAILRRKDVEVVTGYSRSTIYLLISLGLWPKPVHISKRAVGWPVGEIAQINLARMAGKSEDEIRALVAKLEAARKATVWGGGDDQ
jgi:prophage regulatory protein